MGAYGEPTRTAVGTHHALLGYRNAQALQMLGQRRKVFLSLLPRNVDELTRLIWQSRLKLGRGFTNPLNGNLREGNLVRSESSYRNL